MPEWKLDSLLAELAVHRIDLVLSDTPLPSGFERACVQSQAGRLGRRFYAVPALAKTLAGEFPACLNGAPMLVPGLIRPWGRLMQWLSKHKLRPHVVGEFDDGALLKALGHQGHGVFMAPIVLR